MTKMTCATRSPTSRTSRSTVAAAQLDALSDKLETSAQEAAIRKARILAWSQARRVLDDAQRKRIEAAAGKKTK